MGRPINSKYFGNRNYPYDNEQTGGLSGVGGEGVSAVSVSGSFSGKTTATSFTIPSSVIVAPNITGGVKPTLSITFPTATTGVVSVLTSGTGYTSAPTITGAALLALGGGTGTVTLTATLTVSVFKNALSFSSSLTTLGSSAVSGGDIIKQESSRRYLVQNSQGRGPVKLVTSNTLAAGEMNLIATDFDGATYFVKKLTARKATLINRTDTSTALVTLTTDTDGIKTGSTGWTIGSATGTIVTIANV